LAWTKRELTTGPARHMGRCTDKTDVAREQ
jgi:hypothetical protein